MFVCPKSTEFANKVTCTRYTNKQNYQHTLRQRGKVDGAEVGSIGSGEMLAERERKREREREREGGGGGEGGGGRLAGWAY